MLKDKQLISGLNLFFLDQFQLVMHILIASLLLISSKLALLSLMLLELLFITHFSKLIYQECKLLLEMTNIPMKKLQAVKFILMLQVLMTLKLNQALFMITLFLNIQLLLDLKLILLFLQINKSMDNIHYVDTINQMITKTIPIKPYFNVNTLNDPNSINNLMNSGFINQPDYLSLFTTIDQQLGNTQAKFIYKSGKLNGSIFEDGLNNILQSSLITETWGRPIQPPWYGTYPVGNVVTLSLASGIGWKQTQDHSKWCYAVENDYTCFGDMNRITSQWKRGGAFYCLKNPLLNQAAKSIVSSTSTCS